MTEPASPDKRAAKYGSHFNRRLSSRIHRRFASGPGWVGQGRSRDSEAAIRAPYGRLRSHSPLVVYSRGSGIERLGAYFRNDGTSRYRQSCPRCTRQARRSRHGDGWSRHESQQYSWNIEYQLANRRPPRRYPPGGALVFELWQAPTPSGYEVRIYYTAQTLEQMRDLTALTLDKPPARANVFLPGCSAGRANFPCDWKAFQQTLKTAIDPAFVK
jgi:hypothetical protein